MSLDGDLADLGHDMHDLDVERRIQAAHEATLRDIRENGARFERDFWQRTHDRLNAEPEVVRPEPVATEQHKYAEKREPGDLRDGDDPRLSQTDVDHPTRPGPDFPGWRGSAA